MTDDDQQVWVCVHGSQTFHTDPDYDRIIDSASGDWTRAEAEDWGKTECSFCADEVGGKVDGRNYHDLLTDGLDPGDLAPTEFDSEQEVADG